MTVLTASSRWITHETHSMPSSETSQSVLDVAKDEGAHCRVGLYPVVIAVCLFENVGEHAEPLLVEEPQVPPQCWGMQSTLI